MSGRGKGVEGAQKERVDSLIAELEASGGVPDGACADSIDGVWRLLYTSTPGTASPIQRSFVSVDAFSIYQNIALYGADAPATVANVVDFGARVGRLEVAALASTARRPLDGFVPRRGDGRILGLNVFGVSQTAEEGAPRRPGARIDFKFDDAGFDLKLLPFRIPYPVPFRILGDEVKGWIDITYLSRQPEGGLRIARGNKGTTFVLVRE
ncbi:hypothetical protein JKP88DRAFT_194746 [Tribonema minus]|uniref:Plastid lipid-associated protein/fibrillin conserved domain-containing protein n=1 Tax=Tribonema minus TaxID=303371 RepID=A0A835Z824_9STRA|nr:hypothetical protein JKP88DRAFT_194746 [Tribonema minus]